MQTLDKVIPIKYSTGVPKGRQRHELTDLGPRFAECLSDNWQACKRGVFLRKWSGLQLDVLKPSALLLRGLANAI